MILTELLIAQATGSGGGGGIDPVIFMFIVGGLASAIGTLATVLWRQKERECNDLRKENKEIKERLERYAIYAPPVVEVAEWEIARGPSRHTARLPYPYRSSRPSSRGAPKPKP